MHREEIRDKFVELIKPFIRVADLSSITESSLLVNDLKVSSTRFVDIILETEDKFNIRIYDEDVERFERVGSAVDFICEKAASA